MAHRCIVIAACLAILGCTSGAPNRQPPGSTPAAAANVESEIALPEITAFTAGFEASDGFLPLYQDPKTADVYLEVPPGRQRFLHFLSVAEGLGSNPLGFDRGALWASGILRCQRVGRRMLLIEENSRFRADTGNTALERSVHESFPESVQAALPIVAESGGACLVQATAFFCRDSLGVTQVLRDQQQGDYVLDPACSYLDSRCTRAFPQNTEVSVWLTYVGEKAGPILARNAPDGRRATLRVHHSFVALPDAGYVPRRADPRVGTMLLPYHDYATHIAEPLQKFRVERFRLQKADPAAAVSRPLQPIVFYLDPAIPEPLRSAIREGAQWWNQVLESAGFQDALEIHDLPDGADPMDARYSIIQLVHRSERGWSYGGSLVHPETGEILKAGVRLDSHRARTDVRLARGAGLERGGCGAVFPSLDPWVATLDPKVGATDLALARMRQLAAHELGHALGFAHNFAASSYGRASVMDYPAPWIRLGDDGLLDLSQAYEPGPGTYDRFAARYLYAPANPGQDEEAFLAEVVAWGLQRELVYLTDADARAPSSAQPQAALWDNGADPVAAWEEARSVRRFLLHQLAAHSIEPGEPLYSLQGRVAMIYHLHGFALERLIRMLGGVDYRHAVAGDGQVAQRPIAAEGQRAALQGLVQALQPDELAFPPELQDLLVPPHPLADGNEDLFPSSTAPVFDRVGAARGLAEEILSLALDPARAGRLLAQSVRAPELPSLRDVLDELRENLFARRAPVDPETELVQRVVQHAWVDACMRLRDHPEASPPVRAAAEWELTELSRRLRAEVQADSLYLANRIDRFLHRPIETPWVPARTRTPMISPIGRPE